MILYTQKRYSDAKRLGLDASLFFIYSLELIQVSSCPFRTRPKASYKNTEKDARDTTPCPSTDISTPLNSISLTVQIPNSDAHPKDHSTEKEQ